MQRRVVLGTLATTAVGLAGCISSETGGTNETAASNETDGTSETVVSNETDDANETAADSGTDDANETSTDDPVVDHFYTDPNSPTLPTDAPRCEQEATTVEVDTGEEIIERETATPAPYPDPPTAFTGSHVVEFVETFEEAYLTHDALCYRSDSVTSVYFDVEHAEQFDWYEDVAIVFLLRTGGATAGVNDEGGLWAADLLPPDGVVYAVDATGAARVEFDGANQMDPAARESEAPDPLTDGELVAMFER